MATAPQNPNKKKLKMKKAEARLAARIADFEKIKDPKGFKCPGSRNRKK